MSTYKNLEIYQSSFNLAVKIYRLNVSLSVNALLNQGNKLRWISLKIKDFIAEGFSYEKSDEERIRTLTIVRNLSLEVISLLKRIKSNNSGNKQIPELIKSYKQLSMKAEEYIEILQNTKSGYIIPFEESRVMEMAG
ncbi:MAG: four helix bundle protein [Bacteroidales bacterium]